MSTPTPLARSAARQLSEAGGRPVEASRLSDLVAPARQAAVRRAPELVPGSGGPVRRAMARQVGVPVDTVPTPAQAQSPPAAPPAAGIEEDQGYPPFQRLPVTGMRRIIAERLTASKRDAPHYYMSADCLADPLLDMRRDMNAVLPQDERMSVNDLVLCLVARCLRRHPALNAAWDGDAVVRFDHVNLAVAVALDGGLVTPVLRGADGMGLRQIRRAMAELVDAARRRALPREAFQGGTFTVSNLGMYPVSHFAAIVNPPQAAILAVAAAQRRVVALDDQQTAIRRVMTVTLSVDHRVADGVAGAEFLADFKALLEEPRRALL